MKQYKNITVFVTEDEDKFLNGGFEFPTADDKANGYDRAREYLNRALNEGTDERLYSFTYVVKGNSRANKGGHVTGGRTYKVSFTTAQVLEAVRKAEAGETRVIRVDRKGRVEVKRSTGVEFFQCFGKPAHTTRLDAGSLTELRTANKAKYNAAAKGWELECRDAWAAESTVIDAFYVGSFENQKTHDLYQACDVLIYSTAPMRNEPPKVW